MVIALRDFFRPEKVPGFHHDGRDCLVMEATDFDHPTDPPAGPKIGVGTAL